MGNYTVPDVDLEPGQFALKWAKRCAECEEFMPKGSAAGFNDLDEIVCADCWIPWSER